MTTKIDLSELTELPEVFKGFWPTLEELKADLAVAIENHLESDRLMAKMLTNMTSSETEVVKAEIQAITHKMNDMFSARFIGKNRLQAYAVMLAFGTLMHCFTPKDARTMTSEQVEIMRSTGAMQELLKDSRQV